MIESLIKTLIRGLATCVIGWVIMWHFALNIGFNIGFNVGFNVGFNSEFVMAATPVEFDFQVYPQTVSQGNSVGVRISSSEPITAITSEFDGQTVSAFRDLGPSGNDFLYGIYLGTRFDSPDTTLPISLMMTLRSGRRFKKTLFATVQKTDFPKTVLHFTPQKETVANDYSTLNQEAAIISRIFKTVTPASYFSDPFLMPAQGEITSPFGAYRQYPSFSSSKHRGVDIGNAAGTPVVASNAGRVLLSRDFYSHGKTVIVDHGLGILSIYTHLSRRLVDEGDSIERGKPLGLIGDTGIATGPHLHWGISLHNTRVNPIDFLDVSAYFDAVNITPSSNTQ